jgi:peroxiredoxin
MAASSTMLALGTALPAFKLPDVRTAATVGSDDVAGRPVLVVFLCVHCPYVKRIQDGLARFGRDYAQTDLAIVAIASNDIGSHPEDSPENQARVADEVGYPFPVLYDETQEVAIVDRSDSFDGLFDQMAFGDLGNVDWSRVKVRGLSPEV